MVKKIEHLNKVLKDRNRINKANSSKLHKLSKEVDSLEDVLSHKKHNTSEAKQLELEIGDLNQELLLLNDNVSEIEFKIKRKEVVVEELRERLYSREAQSVKKRPQGA
jgi:predicted  nucleic acid-binding Zn-ribbon protein